VYAISASPDFSTPQLESVVRAACCHKLSMVVKHDGLHSIFMTNQLADEVSSACVEAPNLAIITCHSKHLQVGRAARAY